MDGLFSILGKFLFLFFLILIVVVLLARSLSFLSLLKVDNSGSSFEDDVVDAEDSLLLCNIALVVELKAYSFLGVLAILTLDVLIFLAILFPLP